MKATIFGASGGLAVALARELLRREWRLELVTREERLEELETAFELEITRRRVEAMHVKNGYREFHCKEPSDAYFFTQALFSPKPLVEMSEASIADEVSVGLTDIVQLTRNLLSHFPPHSGQRRDYCFIGSTSAYSGFKNTSVYCAVKHGLLGFVRAMNDEYANTDTRFWLFSMGTMNTEMGRRLVEQDPSSFLQPQDVAVRIVEAIGSRSNLFEPEILIRRRTIRYLER